MDLNNHIELYNFLVSFITDERRKKFEEIIKYRTKYLTIVLEDIFQSHNASAVLRTVECLGIQDVHIIENRNSYKVNPDVALGSAKWINIHKYNLSNSNNSVDCILKLKSNGYRIIATSPHYEGYMLNTLPLESPVAVVFGNELDGISEDIIKNADSFMKLPMYGFTESYNISVSAAIALSYLVEKIRDSNIIWELNSFDKTQILLQWVKNTLKKPEVLEREFWNKINK